LVDIKEALEIFASGEVGDISPLDDAGPSNILYAIRSFCEKYIMSRDNLEAILILLGMVHKKVSKATTLFEKSEVYEMICLLDHLYKIVIKFSLKEQGLEKVYPKTISEIKTELRNKMKGVKTLEEFLKKE
jgi:hypothetical protein